MQIFNIMIIDDEYSDMREQLYKDFLSTEYSEIEVHFKINFIEYSRDVSKGIKKKIRDIDAFFIDARLDCGKRGWDNSGYGINFNGVLSTIEEAYKDMIVPPIFMISKHWTDQDLLTMVSKSFSVFHTSVYPSRFFCIEGIESWIKRATEKTADGILDFRPLKEEREYIYNTIEKARLQKYSAGIPIDIVLILAVPDEKDMALKVFKVSDNHSKYFTKYGFHYYTASIGKYNIAIITQNHMGMANASLVATSSILAFNPYLVAMTGICAGEISKTHLCDIIIPSEIFDYSRGKKNIDGDVFRSLHESLDTSIFGYVTNNINKKLLADIRTSTDYGDTLDKDIALHTKPMATGTWVVNDPVVFKEITSKINADCVALDMEAYAIALSARTLSKKWIVIKSVQDFANGMKDEEERNIRKFAAYSSAKLLYDLIPGIMETIAD